MRNFFGRKAKLYSHIMDPRTGYPADGVLAVSVIAPRTVDSEVWAETVLHFGTAVDRDPQSEELSHFDLRKQSGG